jgi:outer membrane protein
VRNSVHAAETRVAGRPGQPARHRLGVFSQTVAAYMDVIRDQAIVGSTAATCRFWK